LRLENCLLAGKKRFELLRDLCSGGNQNSVAAVIVVIGLAYSLLLRHRRPAPGLVEGR
jgi:hypothetical protein